ncbi:MAG: hypothetical protein ACRD13_07175 [Terriglobales bacterium]
MKPRLSPFLCLLLAAALPLMAQAPASTATSQSAAGQSTTGQSAARPHLATRPAPPPDLAALHNLVALMRDKTTTPAQVVQAVAQYTDKFPTSPYRETAYTLGMQFANSRRDYPDMLSFGDAALKVNPNALVPLLMLGSAIPERVQPTDLNREQQLGLAAGYNHRALAIAQHFPTVYNGHQLAPQQVAEIQREIRASAYSSLGVIAAIRGQYAKAVTHLQQALSYDNARSKPLDYYRVGVADVGLKQYAAATAALHQALALGANEPGLQNLANGELQKIQRFTGAAAKPAAPPVHPPAH